MMQHRVLTLAVSAGMFACLAIGLAAASGVNVQKQKPKTVIPSARGIAQ